MEPPKFILGVDLSYVNEMDDCGAVYMQDGKQQDAFEIFNSYGANLVRARLWLDADWTEYSDVKDIKRTFQRAKDAGMFTLLDFHYSDNWADPGKQAVPPSWEEMTDDELVGAVYDYTYSVLMELFAEGLGPDFVQVGNETNSGMLLRERGLDWPRQAKLFNAGIQAVRDVSDATGKDVQIILHVAQPENAGWWFKESREAGITDFDVIGLSYYPQWSAFSLSDLGPHVAYLKKTFGKEVMIVETAYPWTFDAVDETAENILNQGVRGYPISPEGQRQFMIDMTQGLISNGGLGVVYWEPAWISTDCSTRWGQGSHWENATFFDFEDNNEVHEGIEFLSFNYDFSKVLVDGMLDEDNADISYQDSAGDNLESVSHLDLLDLSITEDTDSIIIGFSVAGDVLENFWGRYLIYIDITEDKEGANEDVGRRPINIADPYKPEFRLDVYLSDRKGTVSGGFEMSAWDGSEWSEMTFTGGAAFVGGEPSSIEVQIPKSLLGNPDFINIGLVSAGRGRVHTAGDIIGPSDSPTDWEELVVLEDFFRLDLLK
jgi:arabinogalactan endo-1,4-beta-galactosidase